MNTNKRMKLLFTFAIFLCVLMCINSNEVLDNFHECFAGYWDTEENLIDDGSWGISSWGKTNRSSTSLMLIDLHWKTSKIDFSNTISFDNGYFYINDIYQISDSEYILLIEASSKMNDAKQNFGYYLFSLEDENEMRISHIDREKSALYENEFKSIYLDSRLIYWYDQYLDQTLHRRSGPGFNVFNDK